MRRNNRFDLPQYFIYYCKRKYIIKYRIKNFYYYEKKRIQSKN